MLLPTRCCCQTCEIFTDDFSTDQLATEYNQRSGSWSVGSGALSTSSSLALLRCETAADGGAMGVHASVSVTLATTSDKGRIVVAYVDDNNYWYAELQPGSPNGTLKLFERSGGTDTQRGSTVSFPGYTSGTKSLCLSIGGGLAIASVDTIAVVYGTTPTLASTKAGLGTGSGITSVSFDTFEFKKHVSQVSACESCRGCAGCTSIIPQRLQVVWFDVQDFTNPPLPSCDCSAAAGTWIIDRIANVSAGCAWAKHFPSSGTIGNCAGCSAPGGYVIVSVQTSNAFPGGLDIIGGFNPSNGLGGVSKRHGNSPTTHDQNCHAWSNYALTVNVSGACCTVHPNQVEVSALVG
jgi:hypothetical protein